MTQENERLRRELTAKDQELEEAQKLKDDYNVLQARYEAERKHNMEVENNMPTMFANFLWFRGSLAWMDDCTESLLAVYDIVINDERKYHEDKGLPFDEQAYLLQEFSKDKMAILLPMIAFRTERGKGKVG